MNTDKKLTAFTQPSLSYEDYVRVINDTNIELSTRLLIKYQWSMVLRVNELHQLWTIFYNLGNKSTKSWDKVANDLKLSLLNSKITLKDAGNGTQSFEYVYMMLEALTDKMISEMWDFMHTTKPFSLRTFQLRYSKVNNLQTHAVRRGSADHLYLNLVKQNNSEAILIMQQVLRHKDITSTLKYIKSLENRQFKKQGLNALKLMNEVNTPNE